MRSGLLGAVTDLLGDSEGGAVVVGGNGVVARRFRDLAEAVESGCFTAAVADLAVEGQGLLVVGASLVVPPSRRWAVPSPSNTSARPPRSSSPW